MGLNHLYREMVMIGVNRILLFIWVEVKYHLPNNLPKYKMVVDVVWIDKPSNCLPNTTVHSYI